MIEIIKRLNALGIIFIFLFALTACGGGGSSTPDKTAPAIFGVTDNSSTNKSITPTFAGTGKLNGVAFTSGTVISAEGNYTLEVTDTGGSLTYHFSIDKTAPVVSGVANGSYSVVVTPVFTEGTATLNGSAFSSGTTISTEGNFILIVTDKAGNSTTVNFSLDLTAPVVSNVTNGGLYNTNVTPTFDGTGKLNGASFASGTTVSAEGNYTLAVTDGVNTTTVLFTIIKTAPVVNGVTNNGLYNQNVTPTFNGNGKLNGAAFTSGTSVSNEGTYTLIVTDIVGNSTTVNFTIDKTAPVVTGVANNSYNKSNVTPVFTGSATLNGAAFTSGSTVSAEGNYTLIVLDGAGNSTTVNFVIDKTPPTVSGVANNGKYKDNVTLTFDASTRVWINTIEVNSGYVVIAEGSYTVVANDLAGNSTTVLFSIDKTAPVVSGVSDNGKYNTDKTITFNEGTATLNGVAFTSGSTVSAENTYVLTVTDSAGNATTVNFTVDKTPPTVAGISNNAYYKDNVTITFAGGTATLDGAVFASGTVVSAEGLHTLVVTDGVNVVTDNFTIDKTAPTISVTNKKNLSRAVTTAQVVCDLQFSEGVTPAPAMVTHFALDIYDPVSGNTIDYAPASSLTSIGNNTYRLSVTFTGNWFGQTPTIWKLKYLTGLADAAGNAITQTNSYVVTDGIINP